jgi:hypothetical protein
VRSAAYRARRSPQGDPRSPGHKDIQTTFNVYGHLLPSVHEALGASLDAAFEGSADQDDLPASGRSNRR